jgi:SAM-dependent methyltransferase
MSMTSSSEKEGTIPCPICGIRDEKVCKERVNGVYRIVKCRQCGLTYANPMPVEDSRESYHEVYDGWDYHDIFRKEPEAALGMAKREMRLQTAFWRSYRVLGARPGSFLDVGCGAGHILAAAKEEGWEAVGLEIDEEAFEETAKLWGLDIRPVFLADAGFAENHFDWVRARYVFEHLPRPSSLIRDMLRVLKPGGILTIDVPNQQGFSSRLRILRGKEQGLGQIYGYLDPPIHVVGYSPKTMKLLLEKNGFEVPLSFSTYPGSPVWRPECAPRGWTRKPYMLTHWFLSMAGMGSISVTCGRKPW